MKIIETAISLTINFRNLRDIQSSPIALFLILLKPQINPKSYKIKITSGIVIN